MKHIAAKKGETTPPKTERNQQIYLDYLTGLFTKKQIAKYYDITPSRVAQIIRREQRDVSS